MNRFTYDATDPVTIPPGTQVGLPLTFSDQVRALQVGSNLDEVGWSAIPEGWGPRTYAVRGHILFAPVISETAMLVCCRITVQTMDSITLGALVSGEYDLIGSAGGNPATARTADEPFAWQDFLINPSSAGVSVRQVAKVNAVCNRRLENNEALFLMMENQIGGGEANVWPILRTLCAVEDR